MPDRPIAHPRQHSNTHVMDPRDDPPLQRRYRSFWDSKKHVEGCRANHECERVMATDAAGNVHAVMQCVFRAGYLDADTYYGAAAT